MGFRGVRDAVPHSDLQSETLTVPPGQPVGTEGAVQGPEGRGRTRPSVLQTRSWGGQRLTSERCSQSERLSCYQGRERAQGQEEEGADAGRPGAGRARAGLEEAEPRVSGLLLVKGSKPGEHHRKPYNGKHMASLME